MGKDVPHLENDVIDPETENWDNAKNEQEEDYDDWFNEDGTVEGFDEFGMPL